MSEFGTPQIVPLGATAVLARFGDRIDRDLSLRIARLVDRLDQDRFSGIVDLIPAYTTLIVLFDPENADGHAITRRLSSAWEDLTDNPETDSPNDRIIEIPVVYGGDAGPDLGDVATATGLSPDEVIQRHSGADYTVGALGFAPGFAFLIGLPPELEVPRRATPRTRVPAGSVGIGGAQTGIYSLPTPGGWSLIGRTPRTMFDPEMSSDDELRPGDRVRFLPESAADVPGFQDAGINKTDAPNTNGSLEIVDAGVQTSVQDLGRPGQGGRGITPGGALDRSALVAGNRLLGNPDDAAALEWTLLPPAVRFHTSHRIVLTGTDPGWTLNGVPIAIGDVIDPGAGDELRAAPPGQPHGARGYLCIAGGIDVPLVRDSRALDLSAGFGGGFGRPLQAGDRLQVGERPDDPFPDNTLFESSPGNPASTPFRVVRGPQADRFDDTAWSTFLNEPYTIDAQSNRMGLRLNGPAIMPTGGADVISEGVVTGAIQITGSGQPIVLLPGRATIGGYTKVATVIEADHDRLGQLRPGATIRFVEVSLEEASQALQHRRPSVYGALMREDAEEPVMSNDETHRSPPLPDDGSAWTPDGVIRVVRELASHDVQAFSLRVESAGLEIMIDRGGGLSNRPGRTYHDQSDEPADQPELPEHEHSDHIPCDPNRVITAPMLGIFYRRPTPDDPEFVSEGDRVDAGQTVGLIEVMKTYHEVTVPTAGIMTRILVENGATVEFGEVLMELAPLPEG